MPADQGKRLAEHARQRHEQTLHRAHQTLTEMADAGEPVTVALVAKRAAISRSWIYTQPELRDRIRQLQQHRTAAAVVHESVTRTSDASIRQRLALAHERISQLRTENQYLRDALAHAHGQLRAVRLNAETAASAEATDLFTTAPAPPTQWGQESAPTETNDVRGPCPRRESRHVRQER